MNKALTSDSTQRQWIDLGIHTEACMTLPETCSAAGGAISLWVKVAECKDSAGFISSKSTQAKTGLYGHSVEVAKGLDVFFNRS